MQFIFMQPFHAHCIFVIVFSRMQISFDIRNYSHFSLNFFMFLENEIFVFENERIYRKLRWPKPFTTILFVWVTILMVFFSYNL